MAAIWWLCRVLSLAVGARSRSRQRPECGSRRPRRRTRPPAAPTAAGPASRHALLEEQGVYPHYYPGPNAVRVCNAHYVQEYRPSGTVIVPRMSCYWTRG